MKYDLVVAYRIYPKVSKTPIVYYDNKFKLSELCLKSLKDSLKGLKVKMIVLLDNCPNEYETMFKKYFDEESLELRKLNGIGNLPTFKLQLDILSVQNYSDNVYFAEDDYFYLTGEFKILIDFLKEKKVDFISAYDHLDYYTMPFHNYKKDIIISNGKHWRNANSTCMTFLTTKETLIKSRSIFESYFKRNYDTSLWMMATKIGVFNLVDFMHSLFEKDSIHVKTYLKIAYFGFWQMIFGKKYKLWIPIPSIATHMEKTGIAPNIEWQKYFDKAIKEIEDSYIS
jgi:hypothetical protein